MVPIRFQPHAPHAPPVPHVPEGNIMVPPRSPWAGPQQIAMVSRNSSPGAASAECIGLPSPWFPGTPPLHLGVPTSETHLVQYVGGLKGGTVFHVRGRERLQYEVPHHQQISWEYAPSATSWVEMPQDELQLMLPPHGRPGPENAPGPDLTDQRVGRLIHVRS